MFMLIYGGHINVYVMNLFQLCDASPMRYNNEDIQFVDTHALYLFFYDMKTPL